MEPIELIQKNGLEFMGRFYSFYKGIVLSKSDPKHQGRIKVKVPSIFSGIEVWARAFDFGGGYHYGTKQMLPQKNDVVWVFFEKGEPFNALWSSFHWTENDCPPELSGDQVMGVITPKGNMLILDEDNDNGTLKVFVNERIRVNIIDSDISLELTKDGIIANGGTNLGVMNISEFQNFLQALVQDLSMVGSGSQVTRWMGEGMKNLEDKKFLH